MVEARKNEGICEPYQRHLVLDTFLLVAAKEVKTFQQYEKRFRLFVRNTCYACIGRKPVCTVYKGKIQDTRRYIVSYIACMVEHVLGYTAYQS